MSTEDSNENPYRSPDTWILNLRNFLPFLLDMIPEEIETKPIKPSVLLKELQLSTEERHKKLQNPLRKYRIGKPTDPFQFSPEAIIFQKFEKGKFYHSSVSITNQTEVLQNLRMEFSKTINFSVDSPNHHTRIAPGMTHVVIITFSPWNQLRDYTYEITFRSDEGVFIVPIFALGPRPLINMPDKVVLPPTVVRVPSETTLLLKNSGDCTAWFAWEIQPPFWVSNEKKIFTAGSAEETRVICNSPKAGYMISNMRTLCDDQFYLTTTFECDVQTASLFLEKQMLTFDNIFMGLVCARNIKLHNRSKYTLDYRWKMYDTEKEKTELNKMLGLMSEMKDFECLRNEKLEYMGIIDKEDHEKVYERIFYDEKLELSAKLDEQFLFDHKNFQIISSSGKVRPKSEHEFAIHFAPSKNIFYHATAYLDIAGVEKRIRLELHGNGIGPDVIFSTNCLNADTVYLTEKHQYEIVCRNKGSIPANVKYKPQPTEFGGNISCLPETSHIPPDSVMPFVIAFYSEVEGNFLENLEFEILESNDIIKCAIAGNVVCPSLKSLPHELHFGRVLVGLENTLEFTLMNETPVLISFNIENPNESDETSFKLVVEPTEGVLDAHLEQSIKVTLKCLVVCQVQTSIIVNMWDGKQVLEIPLFCESSFPNVLCDPKEIFIRFGFIRCPYKKQISFKNLSELPGQIEYSPKKDEEPKTIFCDVEPSKVYLKPNDVTQVMLTMYTSSLGPQELPLLFDVGGGAKKEFCTIYFNGQGPVVTFSPDEIAFGKITVLETFEKILTLTNETPIPAHVKLSSNTNAMFTIEKEEFVIEAEKEEQVKIRAHLNTVSPVTDTLLMDVDEGDKLNIRVIAQGIGSCVTSDPRLYPNYDFGIILTYAKFCFPVEFSNKGTIRHKILISKRENVKKLKADEEASIQTIFSINPCYFELEPGQEITINIQGTTKTSKVVEEKFYLHAILGKSNNIQTLLDFTLNANFVDPTLEIDKSSLYFKQSTIDNQGDGKIGGVQIDQIFLNNITGVSFDVVISSDDDNFQIVHEKKRNSMFSKTFKKNESLVTDVQFNPIVDTRRMKELTGRLLVEYIDHPKTEIINLHGEIVFPTIRLFPNQVNFGSIPNASTTVRNIIIHNISTLECKFNWKWLEGSLIVNEQPAKKKPKRFPLVPSTDLVSELGNVQETTETSLSVDVIVNSEATVFEDRAALLSYDKNRYIYELRKILNPILEFEREGDDEDELINEHEYPELIIKPRTNDKNNEFTKYFALAPAEGILLGNCYTTIAVGFHPPPDTEVSAVAICKILGGEEEVLTITGQATHLSYSLDKENLEFGSQIFCEECVSGITLKNQGFCSFDFNIVQDLIRSKFEPEMLEVSPKTGSLEPNHSVQFVVRYFPGFPGEFLKSFVLEVGYLEPVTIEVHGYGVLSQVYLTTSRPGLHNDNLLTYKALSTITSDYLQSLKKDQTFVHDQISDQTSFLENNDWVVVSYNDLYPELIDIDLCVERKLALRHIRRNKNILKEHTINKKISYIPDFYVPYYLVEFGYVVRGKPVCYTIVLYNYGPITTDIKILQDKKSTLNRNEFKTEFPMKGLTLNVHDLGQCYVIFNPTIKRYSQIDEEVEECFHFTVKHGAVIPVKIKATVTIPKVQFDHQCLDFGEVYCGECLRKTIVLTNIGTVSAKWYASIIPSTIKYLKSSFSFTPTEGELNPGRKCFLHIYFFPITEGVKKSILKLSVECSENEIKLELKGESHLEKLSVELMNLNFPPTMSFFKSQMEFTVSNTTDRNIEFYFPDFDEEIEFEKTLIQIYLKYKNLKKVYIPYLVAGERLPLIFRSLYENLIEKLKVKIESNWESENLEDDPLAKYAPHEIDDMLIAYIDAEGFELDSETIHTRELTCYKFDETDDLTEVIEPEPEQSTEIVERNGAILIFHGSPLTDYYKTANEAGIALGFPVYNIDRIIIEALLENAHPSAEDIINRINSNFENIAQDQDNSMIQLEESEYDKLLEKISAILVYKPKKGKKGKADNKPESKKGSKSGSKTASSGGSEKNAKVKGKISWNEYFLDISQDALCDVIREKLKQFSTIIIESLHSLFITKENLVIYTLLKAANFTKHIHVILLSFTLKDYIKYEETKLRIENEKKNLEVITVKEEKDAANDKKAKKRSDKKSVDKKSSKSSKASKKEKATDLTKHVMKNLPKQLKTDLENYEKLENEIFHVCEFWDRKCAVLKKPFAEKNASKSYSSTKESTKSTKTSSKKLSSTYLDPGIDSANTGLYFWIVLNSSRERDIDFSTEIRSALENFQQIQDVIAEVKRQMQGVFEESETLFSVVTKRRNKKNTNSNVFDIKDSYDDSNIFKDEETSINTIASRKTSELSIQPKKAKRKLLKLVKKRSSLSSEIPTMSVDLRGSSDEKLTTKLVLAPGERFKYQVTFSPLKYGIYNQTYIVETVSSNAPYYVKCNAVCDIPRLDLSPEVIFPAAVKYLTDKTAYDNFVYVEETNTFDFGAIILSQNIENSSTYKSAICLKNLNGFNCDVEVFLVNDVFTCEPTRVVIDPNDLQIVDIATKPLKIGTVNAEMYLSIKNNPQLTNFNLSCSPCKLEFNVSPKTINFEKVAVGRTVKKSLKLSNSSPMSLRWRFLEPNKITEVFDVSEVCGIVYSYSVSYVAIRFSPKDEEIISKRQVHLEVYDANMSTDDPFYTEQIHFSADSVEYNLEITDHIDFKEIQGGIDHKYNVLLTNKGKTEVKLNVGLCDHPLPQHSALELFQVSPNVMTIGPMKSDNIQLHFQPKKRMTIKKFPVFYVNLMDAADEDCINSYHVNVSADVFMAKYSVCPPRDINFGYVQIPNTTKHLLQIINKGTFPFSFSIVSYTKYLENLEKGKEKKSKKKKDKLSQKGKNSKKSNNSKSTKSRSTKSGSEKKKKDKQSKTSRSKKSDSKKSGSKKSKKSGTEKSSKTKSGKKGDKPKKITKLELGCFTIIPSTGSVNSNETMELFVEFTPQQNKTYREEILVDIPELSDLKKKKVLTLEGIGCEPQLNLNDFQSVFTECFIAKDLENFVGPKTGESYTIFTTTEVTIHFELVCVNTKKSVGIHIKNIGFILANLHARVDDLEASIFDVSPRSVKLEPYSSCCLEVRFMPTFLGEVKSTLELSYNSSTENKLMVSLIGKACCPQIRLIEPPFEKNESVIKMSPVCVGDSKRENLRLRNVGVITANVIMEIVDDDSLAFQLLPSSRTLNKYVLKNDEDILEFTKPNLMLALEPNEEADFLIQYQPKVEQSIKVTVNVFTVNNPFETHKVIISAESFDNDIVFENLEAFKFDTPDSSNSSLIPKSTIGYLLDFGFAELNKLHKKYFFIENRTSTSIYKFRFYANCVMLTPEVGHLQPRARKEILAVFRSWKPVSRQNEEISCNICRIQYIQPNVGDLSWDDRQKFVLWTADNLLSSSRESFKPLTETTQEVNEEYEVYHEKSDVSVQVQGKMVMEGMEPEIISLSNSFELISIMLNVTSDYSSYNCEVTKLEIPDTYIKEKSSTFFDVENNGNVPFNINWTITCRKPTIELKKSNSMSSLQLEENASEKLHSSSSCSSLFTAKSGDDIPLILMINPKSTLIEPDQKQTFEVAFCPDKEASYEYFLDSHISSLNPSMDTIHIDICAKSLGIPFYFEKENGTIMKRNEILEFESVGAGTESFCTRYLVNSSEIHLSYAILLEDSKEERRFRYFACKTPEGKIAPRRKSAITFSFTPHILGIFKDTFILKIPEKGITGILSLHGVCRQIRVYFREPSVYLNSTVANIKTTRKVTIFNEENFIVCFKFNKKTLRSDRKPDEKIDIIPLTGKILPHSKLELRISFCPKGPGICIFNAKCIVDKMRAHLNLHVTAETRRIETEVTYVNKNGDTVMLSEEKPNIIEFQNIIRGGKSHIALKISNNGDTGMYYSFEFEPKSVAHIFNITFNNGKGFLKMGENITSKLCLEALRLGSLKLFKVKLNISYGPSYLININAVSFKPMFSFSIDEYNFGSCFIQDTNTKYYSTELNFKNLDNKPMRLENCFQNNENFTVNKFTAKTVSPGESKNIKIFFHPKKEKLYRVEIPFIIETVKHDILVIGEGVAVNVQLLDTRDQCLDFEKVIVGGEKKYRVHFLNKSTTKLNIKFDWFENLTVNSRKDIQLEKAELKMPVLPEPPPKKSGKTKKDKKAKGTKELKKSKSGSSKTGKSKKDKKKKNKKAEEEEKTKKEEELRQMRLAQEKLEIEAKRKSEIRRCFTITPNTFFTIPQNGKGYFDVIFKPNQRTVPFTDNIYFETQDYYKSLCQINASAIAPEFCLDKTILTFPNVIVGNSTKLAIALQNVGDTNGRFTWTIDDKKSTFDIDPKRGFLTPHSEAKIIVSFSPKEKKCEFKTKAKCKIFEMNTVLDLTMQGYAAEVPDPKQTIIFECEVRSSIVKHISLANPSLNEWEILSEVSNENFMTPKKIKIPSQSEQEIAIRYFPKTMTKKQEPHTGSLYFKLPNGSGEVYNLVGYSNPPQCVERIEKEIQSKEYHYENLVVENWLHSQQTFKVVTELTTPLTMKTLYKVSGFKTIHLESMESKTYQWGIFVVNDQQLDFKVTFKNQKTGEYLFYEICFKVLPSSPITVIEFETTVRKAVTRQILLENPVNIPVQFNIECSEKSITFDKVHIVNPYTTSKIDITYTPLQTENISINLQAKTEEIGSYAFNLVCKANPPDPEDTIVIKSELGLRQSKVVLFKNLYGAILDFTSKFQNEEFFMERCASINPGDTGKIVICFEPTQIGITESQLVLSSTTSGDFVYNLIGEGINPTPRGPFIVKLNQPLVIEFRNPFKEDKKFLYRFHPDLFYSPITEDVLKPKKTTKILVNMQSLQDNQLVYPIAGKLTVALEDNQNIIWTYFLQCNNK